MCERRAPAQAAVEIGKGFKPFDFQRLDQLIRDSHSPCSPQV